MFLGTATMKITEQTVVLALQEYFSKRAAPGCVPVVKSITVEKSGSYNSAQTFEVAMDEPKTAVSAEAPT